MHRQHPIYAVGDTVRFVDDFRLAIDEANDRGETDAGGYYRWEGQLEGTLATVKCVYRGYEDFPNRYTLEETDAFYWD